MRHPTLLGAAARGFLLILATCLLSAPASSGPVFFPKLSDASATCNECHRGTTPGIYQQWGESKHFRGNVGCFECHGARTGAPGAYEHNGATIETIVTPFTCARCHERETAEFQASRHSKGAEILGSLDNTLAEVVEGNKAFFGGSALLVSGCQQCHGATVKVDREGKPTPDTWPNTGIGRINLDGSRGSCSACHQRHTFSAAQARHPDTCGKCHLGPDHPQKEIYEESKHGISFAANADRIRMDLPKWVVGEDYSVGPTCATCHMSAAPGRGVTHNVGDRISWNNRPEVSIRADLADAKLGLQDPLPWQKRRDNMKEVCAACHSAGFAESFYIQYDGLIDLYNEKFARPGMALMDALRKGKLLEGEPFANRIDWVWFEIWHHQGRRARHGASMQGPDYTHWHGLYEVAREFYGEFLHEARDLVEKGKTAGGAKSEAALGVQKLLDDTLKSDNHRWFVGALSAEEKAARAKQREEFKERYATGK